MSHIEDRWHDKEKKRTERYGSGRRWRVRYIDPSGKERSKSFDRKGDGETFLANVQAAILLDSYIDPDAGRVTLSAFAGSWLKRQRFKSESTRAEVHRRLRLHILPVLGDETLRRLSRNPSVIQEWLAGLTVTTGDEEERRPLSQSYEANLLSQLSSILTAALDDGLIGKNPVKSKSVSARKPDKTKIAPWEDHQAAAVREAMPDRLKAICDAGAALGLRQGEAFGLAREDIDWLRGVVHVRRQVVVAGARACFDLPKGHRERDIPLSEVAKLRLSAHLAEFPAVPVKLPWARPGGKMITANLIFSSQSGKVLRRNWFNAYPWAKAVEAAGMTAGHPNGFHALRHFFASAMLENGVDINALAEYLGHHDPGFTLRVYAHLRPGSDDRMRKAVDKVLGAASDGPDTAREAK